MRNFAAVIIFMAMGVFALAANAGVSLAVKETDVIAKPAGPEILPIPQGLSYPTAIVAVR